MAIAVKTWSVGAVLPASDLNTYVRDAIAEIDPSAAAVGQVLKVNSGLDGYDFGDADLAGAAKTFVEAGTGKAFFGLGAAQALNAYASLDLVGMGTRIHAPGTSAAATASSVIRGGWTFTTGTSSTGRSGAYGPQFAAADDWTMVWRGAIPATADATRLIGCIPATDFVDANNLIAFRVTGTGNVVGVCDSGGTETTRDSGGTGATECTLRIEVREGGTVVRFYKDNAQIGADVTTNIPTGTLYTANGVRNTSTTSRDMHTADWFGWREAA